MDLSNRISTELKRLGGREGGGRVYSNLADRGSLHIEWVWLARLMLPVAH